MAQAAAIQEVDGNDILNHLINKRQTCTANNYGCRSNSDCCSRICGPGFVGVFPVDLCFPPAADSCLGASCRSDSDCCIGYCRDRDTPDINYVYGACACRDDDDCVHITRATTTTTTTTRAVDGNNGSPCRSDGDCFSGNCECRYDDCDDDDCRDLCSHYNSMFFFNDCRSLCLRHAPRDRCGVLCRRNNRSDTDACTRRCREQCDGRFGNNNNNNIRNCLCRPGCLSNGGTCSINSDCCPPAGGNRPSTYVTCSYGTCTTHHNPCIVCPDCPGCCGRPDAGGDCASFVDCYHRSCNVDKDCCLRHPYCAPDGPIVGRPRRCCDGRTRDCYFNAG